MNPKSDSFVHETIHGHDCCKYTLEESTVYGMNIRIDDEDEVSMGHCCAWCGERFFTKEKLKRKLPIINWLPKYSLQDLKGDMIAGVSVAFTIIPQALALATLAGLTANYGLYSSFMGCFVYTLLGTCKDAAVGPTSILAIIVAPYVAMGHATYAIMLSFFSGILMLLLGMLNLGFIVDFISFPVISSFTTASAITIAVSQFKGFLGLKFNAHRIIKTLENVFINFRRINVWDMSMGIFCLLFLVPVQMAKDTQLLNNGSRNGKLINAIWTLTVTGRNAIVVVFATIVASVFSNMSNFTLTAQIELGLPPLQVPAFELMGGNSTIIADFTESISDISVGIFVVALIELMETVAVAKAFMPGKKLDSTQEMVAIGMSNLMGSFVSAFPVSGSFSRSAVNHSSGVRTPLGGVVTGSLVLLALATLAPYFEMIPQTSLSSIIIAAVIPMIKFSDMKIIWKSNKIDMIPYATTFISCVLFGLEYGIIIGVIVSLGILCYQMARPRITIVLRISPEGHRFVYVKPDRSIFFPSIEYTKVKLEKALEGVTNPQHSSLVFDGEHMFRADSTLGRVSLIRPNCSNFITILNYFHFHSYTYTGHEKLLGQLDEPGNSSTLLQSPEAGSPFFAGLMFQIPNSSLSKST